MQAEKGKNRMPNSLNLQCSTVEVEEIESTLKEYLSNPNDLAKLDEVLNIIRYKVYKYRANSIEYSVQLLFNYLMFIEKKRDEFKNLVETGESSIVIEEINGFIENFKSEDYTEEYHTKLKEYFSCYHREFLEGKFNNKNFLKILKEKKGAIFF